jgi:hypothetical protein
MEINPGDVNTGLAVLGAAIGSKELVVKLLGPTADYVGEGLKTFTERRVANVQHIFRIALRRLGSRINNTGSIPPRVLKGILDEGSFCDDPLAAEYFGVVLASSRGETPNDDRGVTFLPVVSSLSAYQIRSHYVFYMLFKRLFEGTRINTSYPSLGGPTVHFYMPYNGYSRAIGLAVNDDASAIAAHCLHGLDRHSLIQGYSYGDAMLLHQYSRGFVERGLITADGLTVSLSPFGAELFSYVHGKPNLRSVNDFLNPETIYEPAIELEITDCAIALTVAPEHEETSGVKYKRSGN